MIAAQINLVRPREDFVSMARDALAAGDNAHWIIGYVADQLDVQYGERTLANFAAEIGCGRRSCEDYRAVFRTYQTNGTDVPYWIDKACVGYTHCRVAMHHAKSLSREGKLHPDFISPVCKAWIEMADAYTLSADQLRVLLKQAFGAVLPEASVAEFSGTYFEIFGQLRRLMPETGPRIRVKVWLDD